ncbi:MAG: hypothetical protein E7263_09355 [Lachnospiraceae bacterium]|nr:hypothetical protein [Lachnospiraceae bacterium]
MIKRLKKVVYVAALFSVVSMGCISASAAEMDAETAVIVDEADTVEDDSSGVHNGKVKVNETNFPDANFRSYLSEEFDSDGDGYIVVGDVTRIECGKKGISSLKGIEYFSELSYLVCSINNLTSLDVTNNTKLTVLFCYENKLTSLDVSNNTKLTELYCRYNNLTSLDVTKCTSLTVLQCTSNELTNLDVTKCTNLTELRCDMNKLTSLDVTNCKNLVDLDCAYNQLTSIDVSNCNNLHNFRCAGNSLTSLDVTNCTSLSSLNCERNLIESLDITNCTNLIYLQCWSNLLNTLDLSKNKSLQRIGIDYELLVNTNNIDKLTSLENIYIFGKFNKNDGYNEYNLKQLGSITNNFTDDNYDKNNYILKIQSDEFVESFENGYGTLNLFTVEKDAAPQVSIIPVKPTEVYYHTHIQGYGDSQGEKKNGEMAGTSGEAKRLENIKIDVDSEYDMIGIQYTTHCQSYGWMPWSSRYEANGTAGEAKRLEAIKIQLTGIHKDKYDVYYRVHAQSYGWLGWAKNGEASGTAGYGKRLEGIQIVVLEKGSEAPGVTFKGVTGSATNKAYYAKDNTVPTVSGADNVNVKYRTHVQTYGWQGFKYNGAMSGTSGEAKRLEGIEIELTNQKYYGDIVYTTHVQTYGWQGKLEDQSTWIRNGGMSGTSGEAKRLEAICINLTSDMAKHYDIYYRVHAQSYGWLGWAKNGECSGTAGYGKRLEGIQIVLVEKGGAAPDNNYGGITANDERAYIEK